MLKSSRSKPVLFLFFGFILASVKANGAPLHRITFGGLSGNPTFTAGVATNTVASDITFFTFDASTAAPDAGQLVTLDLLDSNGVAVANGMSPTSFTTQGGIVNGGNATFPITFYRAGTGLQLRATFSTGLTTSTSNGFTVVVSSATKLLVLGPGMIHVPGTNPSSTNGHSGSFTAQQQNQAFPITVILTDNQFNQVSRNDTVRFTSTDLITLPSDGSLTNGTANFNVTITGAQITRTILVSDLTDTSVLAGSLAATTAGPPAKEVFPFPSPFNPLQRDITFRFRLDSAKDVELKVVNLFGEKVWEKSVSAGTGSTDVTWNGRNENGTVVAVGVYYVFLEIDGSVESKKRFGVIK